MQPDTLSRTIAIVRRELETARAPRCFPNITAETSFERDLRCCAIDLVCITDEVERAFDVRLPAEPLEVCATVGELAGLVQSLSMENAS
jgi:acyl carrier protein